MFFISMSLFLFSLLAYWLLFDFLDSYVFIVFLFFLYF